MFDKYRIVKVLGSGGSATVYLAEHIKLESFRAIKCIHKDNPFYQDALKEAYILKSLRHSNIPIIYDIEEDTSCSYIIEEYFEGESLKSYRLNHHSIQEITIINFAMQICDVIQYLHKNEKPILYLDLKPENIMVLNQTLKLVDFGTALYCEDTNSRKYFVGTKGFAAPEQYKKGNLDERCDIYSVGMLLFYLVTGKTYVENIDCLNNIDESVGCSKKLKNIINRCLKFYPSLRYQTITQLYNKLSGLNHKNNHVNLLKSEQSLKISFAGAQNRIGTTHTSLQVTSYINKYIANCIYIEENEHKVINSIINRYKYISQKNNVYSLYDCNMTKNGIKRKTDLKEDYPIIIVDYGELTENNIEDFLDADIKLLILGAKEWELEASEKVMKDFITYDDIIFLFNFIDGRSFRDVLRYMHGKRCYRIPYVVNPLKADCGEGTSELIQNIMSNCLFGKKTSKTIRIKDKIFRINGNHIKKWG